MKSKIFRKNHILFLILILTLFLHFFRIEYPNAYVFDEVYHGFTAKEYANGSKEAWEWWTILPLGVVFEWTHFSLAKEIMAVSIVLVSSAQPWAWRFPGALFGVIAVFLIYKLGEKIFEKNTGLIAAFLFSLDGLNFVQSRTGMNDIYLVTFSLASLLFLLNKKFLFSAVFLGFAFASKWSAVYTLGLNSLILFYFFIFRKFNFREITRAFLFILILVPAVYLISYLPFFTLGHTKEQFIELQKQIWWYHSNLKATHDYSSPAWSWPLNLYPVWYYVEYHKNGSMSNIFASGNPILFWLGIGAILITLYDFLFSLKNKHIDPGHNLFSEGKVHPLDFNARDKYFIVLLGFLRGLCQKILQKCP